VPAYKIEINGRSCREVGKVEDFISTLPDENYSWLKEALQESQGEFKGSFIGDFPDYYEEQLMGLSWLFPNIKIREACSYFEEDPEDISVWIYRNCEVTRG